MSQTDMFYLRKPFTESIYASVNEKTLQELFEDGRIDGNWEVARSKNGPWFYVDLLLNDLQKSKNSIDDIVDDDDDWLESIGVTSSMGKTDYLKQPDKTFKNASIDIDPFSGKPISGSQNKKSVSRLKDSKKDGLLKKVNQISEDNPEPILGLLGTLFVLGSIFLLPFLLMWFGLHVYFGYFCLICMAGVLLLMPIIFFYRIFKEASDNRSTLPVRRQTATSNNSGASALPPLLIAIGVVIVLLALTMDTTVQVPGGNMRVHNLSLASKQQNYLILGGFVLLGGIVTLQLSGGFNTQLMVEYGKKLAICLFALWLLGMVVQAFMLIFFGKPIDLFPS